MKAKEIAYVIYTAPVLNEYLHELSVSIYHVLSMVAEVNISPYYQPFQWLPNWFSKTESSSRYYELGIKFHTQLSR